MKTYETRNGFHTAEIIMEKLKGEPDFPVVVLLTDKQTGDQSVETYTEALHYHKNSKNKCVLDLVEVKP